MSRFARFDCLPSLTGKRRAPSQGRRRPPVLRFMPHVLALEDRTLPSNVFTVVNLADSGPGSLRQAVLDANANPGFDLIVFAPAARSTPGLTAGQLSITDDLAVVGPGADQLAVSGTGRVVEVACWAQPGWWSRRRWFCRKALSARRSLTPWPTGRLWCATPTTATRPWTTTRPSGRCAPSRSGGRMGCSAEATKAGGQQPPLQRDLQLSETLDRPVRVPA